MNLDQIARDFGPLVAAILGLSAGLFGAIKLILPKLADAYISDRQKQTDAALADRAAKRDSETEEEAAERQNQVALLSQVIQLSTSVQRQNQGLIEFITQSHQNELRGQRAEIQNALRDIDQRWAAVGREITQNTGKIQILTIEISQISERFAIVEQTLKNALNGNFSKKVGDSGQASCRQAGEDSR